MQIETDDLGAQKSPMSGAGGEEGANHQSEEQKRMEGANSNNAAPFDAGAIGNQANSGQPHL